MKNSQEIRKSIVVAAMAIAMGTTVGVVRVQAQAPGAEPALPPSVSVRAARQIGSRATTFLGFRVAYTVNAFGPLSFSEAAAKADAANTGYVEASSTQKVSPENPKNLDYNLSAGDIALVIHRLQELRMRLVAYHAVIPASDSARRELFTFAKAIGAETIVTTTAPANLPGLDKLAAEFDVNVAFEGSDPRALAASLKGLSPHIGINVDAAAWPKTDNKAVGERLIGLNLADVGAGTDQVLLSVIKQYPPPPYPPVTCLDCSSPSFPTRPVLMTISAKAGGPKAFDTAERVAEGYQVVEMSKRIAILNGHPGTTSSGSPNVDDGGIPVMDRWMLRDASPHQAMATPKKPRRLLVLDLSPQGGMYHRTVPYANLAIEFMAKNTGAFTPVYDNDLDNLKYPKIKEYDAVFLNSLVGSMFTDKDVMNGLLRYVREGGGLAAVHGTSFSSGDVPEFGELIGATSAPHIQLEPAMLKIDDPSSPITKMFEGQDFQWLDELYHFPATGPYSREKLHVLVSIDISRSHPVPPAMNVRPDNDYGLVWIKNEGKGRVFNCALGHSVLLFGMPQTAQMMLNAIQYVLGDLDADATPSAKLVHK